MRRLGKAGSQLDELPLTAAEVARRQLECVAVDPDLSEVRASPAVEARPACGLVAVQQLFVAREHARHEVEIRRHFRGAEPLGAAGELSLEPLEVRPGGAEGLERGALATEWMLRQECDAQPALAHDLAGIGLLEPGEQTHDGRLAGSVGPDDAGTRPRSDVEIQTVEHGVAAERLDHPSEAQEGHRPRIRGAPSAHRSGDLRGAHLPARDDGPSARSAG